MRWLMLCGWLCGALYAETPVDVDALLPHCVCVDRHGQIAALHARPASVAAETARVERLFDPDPRVGDIAHWCEAEHSGDVLLWAHGALIDEALALEQLAALVRSMRPGGVMPVYVIGFVWPTLPVELEQFECGVSLAGTWAIATGDDPTARRPSRLSMLHMDDEPTCDVFAAQLLRQVVGLRERWDDIRRLASDAVHYARPGSLAGGELVLRKLAVLAEARRHSAYPLRLHLGGHSAGAILAGHLARVWAGSPNNTYAGVPSAPHHRGPGAPHALRGMGQPLASCTLLAPACNADFFAKVFTPLLDNGALARILVYTLPDDWERTETYVIDGQTWYTGSPLYLLAEALQAPTLDVLPTPCELSGPGGGRMAGFPELRPANVPIQIGRAHV